MYKKIMVPLDGSELAECVLPHVEAFIKGYNIKDVILVRVVEPERPYYGEVPIDPEIVAESEAARKASAMDYLDLVVNQLKYEGTEIHREVIVGRVGESLADCAENNDINLVLIATHGRSGVTRWVRGSVADKILRESATVCILRKQEEVARQRYMHFLEIQRQGEVKQRLVLRRVSRRDSASCIAEYLAVIDRFQRDAAVATEKMSEQPAVYEAGRAGGGALFGRGGDETRG